MLFFARINLTTPLNELDLNHFYRTETKLAREQDERNFRFFANFYSITLSRCMLYGCERKKF